MKNELIPLPKLVTTIDDYVDGGWGNAIAASLVSACIDKQELNLKEFFKDVVDEEWLAIKLELEIKDQINLLRHQLKLIGRDKITGFRVSNLGVHLNGKV